MRLRAQRTDYCPFVLASEPFNAPARFVSSQRLEDAVSGRPPRVIDVEEEDIKSDLEEDEEHEGDPAPIDKLEEGDVLDEADEVAEVEQEEE
jgi:hypothetical protein